MGNLAVNKVECLADNECYKAWWKEGVSDEMKKSACCGVNQIREIDSSNEGYKARVTADKAVVKSSDNAGPVTTNEVGYSLTGCVTGSANDATQGYVKVLKDLISLKILTDEFLIHPDIVKLTTKEDALGLNAARLGPPY